MPENTLQPPKSLLLGSSNFREFIEQDVEYVDKTMWIHELLTNPFKAYLITRPRRFGKTLNMSMLQHFLEAEVNGKSTVGLFDNLNVSKTNVMKEQGKHKVIFLSFQMVKETTKDELFAAMVKQIGELYKSKAYLLDSPKLLEVEKIEFRQIMSRQLKLRDLTGAILNLANYIEKRHGVQPWILLDEYDTPVINAFNHGFYADLVGFMKSFMAGTFKDNNNLYRAIITGVMLIAKEGFFSGANNVEVYTVLDAAFESVFGFTEEEVQKLARNRNIQDDEIAKIRSMYNGYSFGGVMVYNPWSVLNYLKRRVLTTYWVNTADTTLLLDLIARAESSVRKKIYTLLEGKSLFEHVYDTNALNYMGKNYTVEAESLWSLLLMAGYLKAVNITYSEDEDPVVEIQIPNKEVRIVMSRMATRAIYSDNNGGIWSHHLLEHIVNENTNEFESKFQQILTNCTSYFDFGISPETFYHGLTPGLFASLEKTYLVLSNRESGRGRYDLALIPKDPTKKTVIFEFKVCKDESDEALLGAAEIGLKQIEMKKYANYTLGAEVVKIGIGFSRKKLRVAIEF